MICAWTVTSSAVVGSSAISRSGSLATAMAIITRWRMPPENSCGILRMRRSGCGTATSRSSSIARSSPPCPRDLGMVEADRLGDLLADRQHRVQRGQRVLKDHGDARPRSASQLAHAACRRAPRREAHRALDPSGLGRRPMAASMRRTCRSRIRRRCPAPRRSTWRLTPRTASSSWSPRTPRAGRGSPAAVHPCERLIPSSGRG